MPDDVFDFDPDLMSDDPFQILGLRPPVSRGRVKAAHRKLVETYHPDRNREPGASAILKKVNQARDDCMKDLGSGTGGGQRTRSQGRSQRSGAEETRRKRGRGPKADQGRQRQKRSTGGTGRTQAPPKDPPPPPREPVVWPADLSGLRWQNILAPGLGNALASKGRDGVLYLANYALTVVLMGGAIWKAVPQGAEDVDVLAAVAAGLLGVQGVAIWGQAVLQSAAPVELDQALLHDRRTQVLSLGGTALCLVVTLMGLGIMAVLVAVGAVCGLISTVVPLWLVWRWLRRDGR